MGFIAFISAVSSPINHIKTRRQGTCWHFNILAFWFTSMFSRHTAQVSSFSMLTSGTHASICSFVGGSMPPVPRNRS